MQQSRPLNAVLIGLGMVADTHVQAIANLPDTVRLHGVHARTQDTASAFAADASARCGYAVRHYQSIADIVADKVDFAIIATPPNARVELVTALSDAAIPILMEKPIERTSEAAARIVETCEARKIPLGIVFQHRVRASSRQLASLVQSGKPGKLSLVEVLVPWWRQQAYYDEPGRGTYARDGGGVLISQAIHTLDLMLSLTGDVTEVQAMCRTTAFHKMESEDFVTAGLTFANGAVGSMVASTASFPGAAESITLHFDRCVALLHRGILQLHWRDGQTETFGDDAATGGGADPMAFTSDWHRDIIADFAQAIRENHAPLASGREALKVHYLIDALVESSRLKRAVEVTRQS